METDGDRSEQHKQRLIRLLQSAYSGERAAALAYRGHARSVSNLREREEIRNIEQDEWHHRQTVGRMLWRLGAHPAKFREFRMMLTGRTISVLCHVGGWFIPMYGAGRLESANVREYEEAARVALRAGYGDFIDDLLTMAEVEWDHERYFGLKASSHWMWRFFPKWSVPPPKESIRASFEVFCGEALSPLRRS